MMIGVDFGPEYHPDGCTFIGGRITYTFSKKVNMNFSTTFHEFQSSKRTEGLGYAVVDELLFVPILNYTFFEKYHLSLRSGIGIGVVLSAHDLGGYGDESGEWHWKGRNDLFLTLIPAIELNYNIPKTTIHLSLGLRRHDHLGYWKELNHYFSLVYSLSFEIFK